MKRFVLLLLLLFCNVVFADTITINWGADNQTYTTTTCTVGGDVLLPTAPTKRGHVFRGWVAEHFDRGTFANWNDVPSNDTLYLKDVYGNTTPLENDTIIMNDASEYYGDFLKNPDNIIIKNGSAGALYASVTIGGNTTTYYYEQVENWFKLTDNISIRYQRNAPGQWRIKSGSPYYINNVQKTGEVILAYATGNFGPFYISENEYGNVINLQGTWKFVYDGIWEIDGKFGWKPDQQIVSE